MQQTYVFRIVLDYEEDVFRDVSLASEASFLELYQFITASFNFKGEELGSFFLSNDDWEKGEEITLVDMGFDFPGEVKRAMADTKLNDLVTEKGQKLICVYDFMRMWCFFIELIEIKELPTLCTPELILSYGKAPKEDSKEIYEEMDLVADYELDEFDEFSDVDESEGYNESEGFDEYY